MSILQYPRINFTGIFRANPCTSNNDDVLPEVVNRDTNTLGPSVNTMSPADIVDYMRGGVSMKNYDSTPNACIPFVRSGWNLYGDHSTNFLSTATSSAIDPNGKPVDDPTTYPSVGLTVEILGSETQSSKRQHPVMVDLDPTGLVTTQIFVGGLRLTAPDGTVVLEVDHDVRAFQDWLNFSSTVTDEPNVQDGDQAGYGGEQNFVSIGCFFMFTIPASALPSSVDAKYVLLNALLRSAQLSGGLSCRFRVHEVEPAILDEKLTEAFANRDGVLENPAYGYLVGTLGLWDAMADPMTEPGGRKLIPPSPRDPLNWGVTGATDKSGTVGGAEYPWAGPPALVGNIVAYAQPNTTILSLDMAGAFPKYRFRHQYPSSLENYEPAYDPPPGFDTPVARASVGRLFLYLVPDSGGSPILLGEIQYGDWSGGLDDFEKWGGIQELNYVASGLTAQDLQMGSLRLAADPSGFNAGTVVLDEIDYRLATDDRGVYVMPNGTTTTRLRAWWRGTQEGAAIRVFFREYANIIEQQTQESCEADPDCETTPTCTDGFRPNQTTDLRATLDTDSEGPAPVQDPRLEVLTVDGYQDGIPYVTVQPSAGWQDIEIQALHGGAALLNYQQEFQNLEGTYTMGRSVPAWSTQTYSCIRIYPDESFDDAREPDGTLSWDTVFTNALEYYYVLFPAMNRRIDLSQPFTQLYASYVKQRLHTPDSPEFYNTYNMPVTRTMSPARVQLVLDWIDQEYPPDYS